MTVAPLRLHVHVEELEQHDPKGRTAAEVALAVLPGLAGRAQAMALRVAEREVIDYDPDSPTRNVSIEERTYEALVLAPTQLVSAVAVVHQKPGGEQPEVVSRAVTAWPRAAIARVTGPDTWSVVVRDGDERVELKVNAAIAVALLTS